MDFGTECGGSLLFLFGEDGGRLTFNGVPEIVVRKPVSHDILNIDVHEDIRETIDVNPQCNLTII